MMPEARVAAPLSADVAARVAAAVYGLTATIRLLPGEYDDNFHLQTADSRAFVLKLMHPTREDAFVDMQCRALTHLAGKAPRLVLPRVIPTGSGELYKRITLEDETSRLLWMLSYLPGTMLAETKPHTPELLESLGRLLAEIDLALMDFKHPWAQRFLKWDLSRSNWARDYLGHIANLERRALARNFLNLFEEGAVPRFSLLRRSVIYGDANDHNALVDANTKRVVSVIDFGDMHEGFTVGEPAIAAAYAILGKEDPLAPAAAVLAGYHGILPLREEEIAAFFPLMAARLAVSVVNSAHRKSLVPDDPYVTVSEELAWAALQRLAAIDPRTAREYFQAAATKVAPVASETSSGGSSPELKREFTFDESLGARKKLLGANLSLSYETPLKIVRGSMQHMYDETGRAYLDVYNNVPLVGHSHPRVVRAIQEQVALLNTNTRYLHDNILRYAQRLTALLPDSLQVCYFVNSGSEANELALRLARTHTGREDVIVLEHAYHGHTSTLIDISPYKFSGPGGRGRKPWVHVAPIADDYRGKYRRGEAELGKKYAGHVEEILSDCRKNGQPVAAYIAETLPSVAGQIVFPPNYLSHVYEHVRKDGAVCIADEVQVGFGRLGTHFWGFGTQGVVPDIVVFGKPMGNSFPLAAVVTTREIAASFANGMEFFSTFGGNPVACAAGLAVLDVLRDENLQQNALTIGTQWIRDLRELQAKHSLIGDVRGLGLFLGVDLVTDRETCAPATRQASHVVNRLREEGILAGTDGPQHNVIKLRPPLCFTAADARSFTSALDSILREIAAQPPA
ncbi:MAG TPA: aminotransferase class III-fold pyridoxal phosphate-dependent enzyme [Candidatus Limnocylindrales bacterium]|nr:aminotransferase class III-fold pyridoxal phosphate-dependent enzyme [Candidatus Limnocylindrales bacterium]